MRDVTGREFHRLSLGYCPQCGCETFQPGPRGGSAQNVECIACGERFNVTIVGTQLLFAQAIGHHTIGGDWEDYERKFAPGPLFERGH